MSRSSHIPVHIHARVRAAVVAALVAPLAACSSSASSGGPAAEATPSPDDRPVTVSVTPTGKQIPAGEPVRVTVSGGRLTSVTVTDAEGHAARRKGRRRRPLLGLRPQGRTRYDVRGDGRDPEHGRNRPDRPVSFTTAAADKVNKVDWRPGTGTTVGVAQPISLVFDHPVRNRAEVEKQLKVTTSNDTEGSWGWMRDWSGRDRVDWRPRTYWKPGTEVRLKAELNGTDSGAGGGWFVRDYTTAFTVGDRQIVEVDLDRHQLTLVRNGETVRRIPVSGGTPGGDKRSWRGTAVLMAKEGTINMNSETVGLADAYDKMVDHSMRLTWSGMYAHAAPWNARHLGRANRSSGCIGMSDADAAWFYGQVRPGDPFEITGKDTKGVVAPGNGFGAWNLSWAEWKRMSALR